MVGLAVGGLRCAWRVVGHNALGLHANTLCAGPLLVALEAVQAAAIAGSGHLLPLSQTYIFVLGSKTRGCVATLVVVMVVADAR